MIAWRDEAERLHRGSLFAVFAALARGEAWSFPALRAHQREPWHAFTVQTAAMALLRAGTDVLPHTDAGWRDLLVALTPDGPEAWELVVDDWTKPALLQPPVVSPADRAAYRNRVLAPDEIDTPITAKDHDLKQARMVGASDESWLFALVALQTTEGFMGAGNYGVARMNGGFANRMSLGIRPADGGAAGAFVWDVRRILAQAAGGPDRRAGIPLLWTIPWDGTASLAIGDLDELFVEICRRVRLERAPDGTIAARTAGSKVSRIAYKELGGNTGDPWAPLTIDRKKESVTFGRPVSVTANAGGFGYRQLGRLLDPQQTMPSPMMAPAEEGTQDLAIVAAALVRGQGKTEGLHRRSVRIATQASRRRPPVDRIGAVSSRRAADAWEAGRRLRRALMSLVQGGPDQARLDDDAAKKKTDRWLVQFDRAVDATFFDAPFWAETAEAAGNHVHDWRVALHAIARTVFEDAAEAAPGTQVRRIRARARAQSLLRREMQKWTEEVK